ncbi:hypothetical protein [Desulfosediminicola flagellatus]|uniref:hypothetical protein n=1 Tax=Desulfosediminicola flagellatus TaxID=2569541 RepID=UPI0010ACC5DB|nr:hypothetical protein [Desulfosediminicola flagellatus]
MKYLSMLLVCFCLVGSAGYSFAASARCEVVSKDGDLLVMDCGKQSKGFDEKSKVKIKTDRDKK